MTTAPHSPLERERSNAMPYHPNNLSLVSYPPWRVKALARMAQALGVLIHIDGIPFGREQKRPEALQTSGHDVGAVEARR